MNFLLARFAAMFAPTAICHSRVSGNPAEIILDPRLHGDDLSKQQINGGTEAELAAIEELRKLTRMDRRSFLRVIGGSGLHLAVAGPMAPAAFFDIGGARRTALIHQVVAQTFAIANHFANYDGSGLAPLDLQRPSYAGMAKRALAEALRFDPALTSFGSDGSEHAALYAAPFYNCGGAIPISELRAWFFAEARRDPRRHIWWDRWNFNPGFPAMEERTTDPRPSPNAEPQPDSREPEPLWENPWLGIRGGIATFHRGHRLPFIEDLAEGDDYTLPWGV